MGASKNSCCGKGHGPFKALFRRKVSQDLTDIALAGPCNKDWNPVSRKFRKTAGQFQVAADILGKAKTRIKHEFSATNSHRFTSLCPR